MYDITITNEGDIMSKLELSGRGISKVCTNLAGEHCYRATEKAEQKLIKEYNCGYENGNGQIVEMVAA